MSEDKLSNAFPMAKILRGRSVNNVNSKTKIKKDKQPIKYNVFKLKYLIGALTKEQLEDFFSTSWETIKSYLNKDKRFQAMYYIRSIPKNPSK